ncbi:MAG: ADP-ribose pyrophosphatase YjhB (NUDIX family) [Planctomycetaceae bacterium]|jgi:ADP-ribose pyrophosphatase YjhB (NUDIX family)
MKQSAGTLLYREGESGLEVLIVHPSGNYNRKSPWSIPKGLVDDGEDFESTARRETLEEAGVAAEELVATGSIDYTRSRKRIHCFVGLAPSDAEPRCGKSIGRSSLPWKLHGNFGILTSNLSSTGSNKNSQVSPRRRLLTGRRHSRVHTQDEQSGPGISRGGQLVRRRCPSACGQACLDRECP